MVAFLLLALVVQDPSPVGMLSGMVVNASTGAPLVKVELRATLAGAGRGSTAASTTTDAKGHFTMVDLPAGEYRLQGMRNGYLDTYYGARRANRDGTPIQLGPGDAVKGLELRMAPSAVLAGTVRDPDGEPVPGAAIVLLKQIYEYGRPKIQTQAYFENKTDDQGQYRIANLEPGKYWVRAIPRSEVQDRENQIAVVDHSLKSDDPRAVFLPTLYPGVTDAALARMVEVGPGAQVTGVDIPMVRAPVFHVTVIATVPPGATIDGMYLESNPESLLLSLSFPARRNQQGDFEFAAVPAGLYTLVAGAALPTGEAAGKGEPRRVSGRLTALRVNRDYTTRITVAQPWSSMATHVRVAGEPDAKPPRLAMAVVGDSQGVQTYGANTDYVDTLPPDHYQLYLEDLPAGLAVKSMRIGGADVFQNGFTVGEEADRIDLEIVLAPEAGVVDGTVLDKDGKPAPGATVLLVAEPKLRARYDSFHSVTADQQGRFHFDNVRPGDYKLFAWDDIEPNAWFDADFLKRFEDRAAPLTLQPKGHTTAPLHEM